MTDERINELIAQAHTEGFHEGMIEATKTEDKAEKLAKVIVDIEIMVKENLHGHKYNVGMEDIEKRIQKHREGM